MQLPLLIVLMDLLHLVSVLEFAEETHVVLAEHAQVFYHILEVGNALNAHTKCITSIDLTVDAAKFKHIGVDHATAEDFYPTGVLTEATALAAT